MVDLRKKKGKHAQQRKDCAANWRPIKKKYTTSPSVKATANLQKRKSRRHHGEVPSNLNAGGRLDPNRGDRAPPER
jgi:hypothetical protein